MEFKQIQELIKQVNKSSISELKIKDGEFQITIKQGAEQHFLDASQMQMPMMMPMQMPPAASAPAIGGSAVPEAVPVAAAATGTPIKSPMIGTFYRSAGPEKPVFVSIGDEVKVGQVICIIEAMKLFNEIESEVSGRVIKVLADDASPVEYDQPLFLVEPI